ncbi:hypothetical protein NLX71_16270 [Paenibacillus sp. MZ04-78.2]|uniref:hypothetical protein n=1 Tax=Paenibacillus sp. MZ04-78.2 TaxID=2962034 RepID=UPI0020B8D24C|nr:hypothetical protein [Paenibacillus sp. MZ04-78.2]MCP3774842.1 hypothetical protein [Paenibacillus sp. MZ04-78.2]
MTGNIGFHHIHHLDPQVSKYNLQQIHESNVVFCGLPYFITCFSNARPKGNSEPQSRK